jgi:hypothetical protein
MTSQHYSRSLRYGSARLRDARGPADVSIWPFTIRLLISADAEPADIGELTLLDPGL